MKRIGLFLTLVVAFSLPLWWPARTSGFLYTTLLMFAPAAAAVASLRILGEPLSTLGWRGSAWRWVLAGWAIPVLAIAATGVLAIAFGAATFPDPTQLAERATKMGIDGASAPLVVALLALLSFTGGIVSMSAAAVGEEIGWRGYLVPAIVQRASPAIAALATGLVWWLWHFPLFLMKMPTTSMIAFGCSIMGLSFLLTWLRLKSNSIWPPVIAHGTHNAAFALFWDKLLMAPEDSLWSGEASFTLALTYALIAIVLWRRERP